MTQEQFDTMMDSWLARRAQREPGRWSAQARAWSEAQGLVAGDSAGAKRKQSCATREETEQMHYRKAHQEPTDEPRRRCQFFLLTAAVSLW